MSKNLEKARHAHQLFDKDQVINDVDEQISNASAAIIQELIHNVNILGVTIEKVVAETICSKENGKKDKGMSLLERRQREREANRKERLQNIVSDMKMRLRHYAQQSKLRLKEFKRFVKDPLGWKEFGQNRAATKIQALVRGYLSRIRRSRELLVKLQAACRRRIGRKFVERKMMRETVKHYESHLAKYYYSSPAFKPSPVSWDPPRMLKDKYIPFGKRSRKHDHAWTEVEAAITLQCMYRCRKVKQSSKNLSTSFGIEFTNPVRASGFMKTQIEKVPMDQAKGAK